MAESKISKQAPPGAVDAAASELQSLHVGEVETVITQALPISDIAFGGTVLVIVIVFHAFWIRVLTSVYLTRVDRLRANRSAWRADGLFILMVISLLVLHLAEVVLWSAALVLGGLVPDWSKAAYFASNCYTALGEPFALPHDWRIVPPIIAMSGIFAFGWTASVFVNFVSRYNDLRAAIMGANQGQGGQRKGKT